MCICNDGVITEVNGSLIEYVKCIYCEREDGLVKLKIRLDKFNREQELLNGDNTGGQQVFMDTTRIKTLC